MPTLRRIANGLVRIVLPVILVACGATSPSAAPGSSGPGPTPPVAAPTGEPIDLVVVGDSIPFAAFCPGCTGFVEQYAADLQARTGRPIEVANRSRNDSAGLLQIQEQVTGEQRLRDQLAAAEVVVVSIGFNDALPDAARSAELAQQFGGDWGCLGDMGATIESYVDWALTTTDECRRAGRRSYAAVYDTILSTITELRSGAPTALIMLNVYDANLQHAEFLAADLPADTSERLWRWMTRHYDEWNNMVCDRAAAHGFTCVDLYHAFNGNLGERPIGALSVDGSHPSQRGNDLIADLLSQVDISQVAPG